MASVPGMPGATWMPGMPGRPGGPGDDFQLPPADVSHISRKWLDMPYAPTSAAQRLDIYLPDQGGGPLPVLFVIHGGAFEIGDKRDINLPPYLRGLERGYAVVSVNYRLSGEAIFPAGPQDVRAAIRTFTRAWLPSSSSTAPRTILCLSSSPSSLPVSLRSEWGPTGTSWTSWTVRTMATRRSRPTRTWTGSSRSSTAI
jgi:hypothetical protein